MEAKILTYDSSNGTGTLITRENEKKNFSITDWNDFNISPRVGLVVNIDNDKLSVQKLALLKIKKEKYINSLIANELKLTNNNEEVFVIEEKFLLSFIIFSIILAFLVSSLLIIVSLSIVLSFQVQYIVA